MPGEKLLEFNVKQGWGLMCETLGCEALDWEFSRVNVRIFFVAHRVSFFSGLNVVIAKNFSKYLVGFAIIGLGAWCTLKRR